jgi:hypothetical protein
MLFYDRSCNYALGTYRKSRVERLSTDEAQLSTTKSDGMCKSVEAIRGHTRRNHLRVLHETGHVCFWSHTDDGNASEKSLAELGGDPLPPGRGLDQEKDFPGFVLPGLTIVQPQTTPRGGELTPPEQATHRRRAAISRRIAHAMGGVTRDRMGQEHIRLVQEGIRASMRETCGGLPHFR